MCAYVGICNIMTYQCWLRQMCACLSYAARNLRQGQSRARLVSLSLSAVLSIAGILCTHVCHLIGARFCCICRPYSCFPGRKRKERKEAALILPLTFHWPACCHPTWPFVAVGSRQTGLGWGDKPQRLMHCSRDLSSAASWAAALLDVSLWAVHFPWLRGNGDGGATWRLLKTLLQVTSVTFPHVPLAKASHILKLMSVGQGNTILL